MKELSLHVLDIAQNSLAAGASVIEIVINEQTVDKDIFEIKVKDNGYGMDPAEVKKALDPFYTTRATRRVGLGLPLLQQAAERCDGRLMVTSQKGKGTTIRAIFRHSHIDRAPLGDIVSTLLTLIALKPEVDYIYRHRVNRSFFSFDTREIKQQLGDVEINNLLVVNFLKEMLQENIQKIRGGAVNEIFKRVGGN